MSSSLLQYQHTFILLFYIGTYSMCCDRYRCFKPLPILIFAIVLWTYYAYVYEMCLVKMTSKVKRVAYLSILHFFLLIMAVHYFMAMFILPGEVPGYYRLSRREVNAIRSLEPEDRAICRILEVFCEERGIRTYTRKNNCIRLIAMFVFLAWTYYVYVYELCILRITPRIKRILYLALFHFLLSLTMLHYLLTMFTKPRTVPDLYRLNRREFSAIKTMRYGDKEICKILESFCEDRQIKTYMMEDNCIRYCRICRLVKPDRTDHCYDCKVCVLKMDHHCVWIANCVSFTNYKIFLLLLMHTIIFCLYYVGTTAEYVYRFAIDKDRAWRQLSYVIAYCMKCRQVKPDRTHHCSTCEMCVLKMDHHCPWVDNCVSFTNYKIFLLLLIHSAIYCVYYSSTSAEYVYVFAVDEDRTWWQLNYVAACGVAGIIAILLMCLFGFHISAMLRNETTLETMSDPDLINNCTFDLGTLDNVVEVLGYNWCLWFIPIHTSLGDGVEFPIKSP